MKKYISRLHYLTQDLPHRPHVEQARVACEAGANWVQYRCLSKPDSELLSDLREIGIICDDWGATLIVTGHVHLLGEADVQGVHIENMAADLSAIRRMIGPDRTLGASANNFEDIRRQSASGDVDYFGCGPFGITKTKPNNYPLLGVEGYAEIVTKMKEARIDIPVLAVGGVGAEAVPVLLKTGVYGIAVSAAVNLGDDPAAAYRTLHRMIY
jgi:thiamine-phosphate pyrophosphorylase